MCSLWQVEGETIFTFCVRLIFTNFTGRHYLLILYSRYRCGRYDNIYLSGENNGIEQKF
jgi:hypothetical protein